MIVFIKLSLRNIVKNRKRSLLIGTAVFISCFLLIFSNAIGNGLGKQIMDQYRIMQSGDVAIAWENIKEYDLGDPSRLLFSDFDGKKDKENMIALKRVESFLQENTNQIKAVYKPIRKFATLDTGRYASFVMIYGMSLEEMNFLLAAKRLNLITGYDIFDIEYGLYLSQLMADENNIKIGDWVILDAETKNGYVNSMEYRVAGIYKASSDFDSIFVYMTRHEAQEFLNAEADYFSIARIFLNNPASAADFTSDLNTYLGRETGVLVAETGEHAAEFYSTIAGMMKLLFSVFSVFLLFMIAIGLRSTVRMNLFQRLAEFGTLRAIGFSRWQNFIIIFLEIFFLSLISFFLAVLVVSIIIMITGNIGIYVGQGTISFALGSEYIYPFLGFSDFIYTLLVISLFSLFTPLKPGLRLVLQKITDMLARRQKSLFVSGELFKGFLLKKSRIKL